MSWISAILDQVEHSEAWGFRAGTAPSAEPAALAAMALAAHGRADEGLLAARWLMQIQAQDGSVGLNERVSSPGWMTSLAILAWESVAVRLAGEVAKSAGDKLREASRRGTDWLLIASGERVEANAVIQHDTTLVGWSWVDGTHSWLEPTALAVLALKSRGLSGHERVREGVKLMINRLLPDGGCNYGNTVVLENTLRPHLQPSGVVLTALVGEENVSERIEKTLRYVERSVGVETTASSLAWGLHGLASHGRLPNGCESWLEASAKRTAKRGASLPRLTLLTLAALGTESPLIILPQQRSVT